VDESPQSVFARSLVKSTRLALVRNADGLSLELGNSGDHLPESLCNLFEETEQDDGDDIFPCSIPILPHDRLEHDVLAILTVERFLAALRQGQAQENESQPAYAFWTKGVDRYEWGWQPVEPDLYASRVNCVTKTLSETLALGFLCHSELQGTFNRYVLDVSLISDSTLLKARVAQHIRYEQVEVCIKVVHETMQIFASRLYELRKQTQHMWFFTSRQKNNSNERGSSWITST
jgi:hypothetical protein